MGNSYDLCEQLEMLFYKRLLKFIQIFVVLVVLPRVASFLGLLGGGPGFDIHDLIRWAFAATLGLGVVATSYFSEHVDPPEYDDEPANPKERRRREREAVYFAAMNNASPVAGMALIVFAFLDGAFNLADAIYQATASGLFLNQPRANVIVYWVATVIFGIAPTLLSIVLARVIARTDRIPAGFEKTPTRAEVNWVYSLAKNMGLNLYSSSQAAHLLMPEDTPVLPERTGEHRTEQRTANQTGVRPNSELRTGEQKQRIVEALQEFYSQQITPSITDIQNALGDPVPSRSTISTVRSEWLSANSD